jgi:hypothetical protein
VSGIGASLTDRAANVWTIDSTGQITVNGTVDMTTGRVNELALYDGVVWQKNADNHWYSKTSRRCIWGRRIMTWPGSRRVGCRCGRTRSPIWGMCAARIWCICSVTSGSTRCPGLGLAPV